MAQRTTPAQTPEEEIDAVVTTGGCCHHWSIQPADGPISSGTCQVCGETREFKNYVESASWGDSRTTTKGSSDSAKTESTSDDAEMSGPDSADHEHENDAGPDDTELESEE